MAKKDMSVDALIEESVRRVMRETAQVVAQKVAMLSASVLNAELASNTGAAVQTAKAATKAATPKARRAGEIDKWIPDRRARRVPTFVIEMTGLDTKKKIVEKYGAEAVFKKGSPAPKMHAA